MNTSTSKKEVLQNMKRNEFEFWLVLSGSRISDSDLQGLSLTAASAAPAPPWPEPIRQRFEHFCNPGNRKHLSCHLYYLFLEIHILFHVVVNISLCPHPI